jgi:hypothetical protein
MSSLQYEFRPVSWYPQALCIMGDNKPQPRDAVGDANNATLKCQADSARLSRSWSRPPCPSTFSPPLDIDGHPYQVSSKKVKVTTVRGGNFRPVSGSWSFESPAEPSKSRRECGGNTLILRFLDFGRLFQIPG